MKRIFVLSAFLSLFIGITFADGNTLISTQQVFCVEDGTDAHKITFSQNFTFEYYMEAFESTFSGTWDWEDDSHESIDGNVIDVTAPQEVLKRFGLEESGEDVNLPLQFQVTCKNLPWGVKIEEVNFGGHVFEECD